MAYANGRIPASALTTVQSGSPLSKPTAVAWYALKAAAKAQLGRVIYIAGNGAGAYRSYWVQDQMHAASVGSSRAAKLKWFLNPNSSVPLAQAGYSSHGFGTRVDIVGTAMDTAFLNLAKRYGFTREFGPADPNHFMHDGKTAIKATVVKKVANKAKTKKVTYVVKSGDTLTKIAAHFSTDKAIMTVDRLLALNKIADPDSLHVGQKLKVA